jgi:predicted phosphatase
LADYRLPREKGAASSTFNYQAEFSDLQATATVDLEFLFPAMIIQPKQAKRNLVQAIIG